MPRPFALPSGVFHLNIRVPSDLAASAKGTPITVPVDGKSVTVKASDKVIVSLRTKDPSIAKVRFAEAAQALARHWDALRLGPRALTHKQTVALAGEFYRTSVELFENDTAFMPNGYLQRGIDFELDIADWQSNDDDGGTDIGLEKASILAALSRPSGPHLLAFELNRDIDLYAIRVTYLEAIEHLFGQAADTLCRERQLVIDGPTRLNLIRELASAHRYVEQKLKRSATGDYSPDANVNRFPEFVSPPPASESPTRKTAAGLVSVATLFDRWTSAHLELRAASTLRRYTPSLNSLAAFTEERDVRSLTDEDIWLWAEHRQTTDGIAPATINRNDLVAASSVLKWATTRSGGKLRMDNPADGVKLEVPKKQTARDKTFLAHEIAAILRAARAVKIDGQYPRASASRRWAAWLCAYSGARIQEVCWLRREDVWLEGGIWVMRFPQTKDGHARTVPLHEELIREGFLTFWKSSDEGYLFVSDRQQKAKSTRTPQEQRASELAGWVRSKVDLPSKVSPNHGWRHTFCTLAEAAGIPKRFSNAITGHNKRKDASDGYVAPSPALLKVEMDKFPIYDLNHVGGK